MHSASQVICWVVTDGKSGMENQCLGLAEALGITPIIKRVKLRSPWRQLSPFLKAGLAGAFSPEGDAITPPWPDLLIATGRLSVPASLLVKKVNPGTFIIQLQNPVIDPANFDLVVVPEHDKLRGPNVMVTRGALHRVTPKILHDEAQNFLPRIAHLPFPRIAVLIGGSNAVYRLTPKEMEPVAEQLALAAKVSKGGFLVTPSRRTGAENIAVLREKLRDVPAFIWDEQGPNPYFGMLGAADFIIATCDSVNMVTEACSTGKPVFVVDLPGGSPKFTRFHDAMRRDGYTRKFEGKLERWTYKPLEEVRLVAERVRASLLSP